MRRIPNIRQRTKQSTILKTDYWSLPLRLLNSQTICRTPEPATTLLASFSGAAHRHTAIMVKLNQRSLEKISFHKLKVCLKELREARRWLRLASRLRKMNRHPRWSRASRKPKNSSEFSSQVCGQLSATTRDATKFTIRCSMFGVWCSTFKCPFR